MTRVQAAVPRYLRRESDLSLMVVDTRDFAKSCVAIYMLSKVGFIVGDGRRYRLTPAGRSVSDGVGALS